MSVELLPSICQLKILRFLTTPDIIACSSVSHAWYVMVDQLWSKAVTYVSIPKDFGGRNYSAVSEGKCQEILSTIEDQLEGIEINLAYYGFDRNHHGNLFVWMNNRFPALQSLCLWTPWAQFDGQTLSGFEGLRSLTLCFSLDDSLRVSIPWDMVLPQFRFLREFNLEGARFMLSEDQVRAMPSNFFLSLEMLSFTDVNYESNDVMCLFVEKCKNLRKFGFSGSETRKLNFTTMADYYIDITRLVYSLQPGITVLHLKDLRTSSCVGFDEIMSRFQNLKDATLCESSYFATREFSCHAPLVNITLGKLIVTVGKGQERIINLIANAQFRLVHLEIHFGRIDHFLDEYVKRLILGQKTLEVLKVWAVGQEVEGAFFKQLLKHSTMKLTQFSGMTFRGLPKRLQTAVNMLPNPSSVNSGWSSGSPIFELFFRMDEQS